MKKLLGIVVLGLLLCNNGIAEESSDWEVLDIIDSGIKEGDIDHPQFRSQAINHCTQNKKFTFQFKGSDRVQTTFEAKWSGNEHIMRYYCSRNKMTKDPIMGDTYRIKSLLGKIRYRPNFLYWNNYNESQKIAWDKQDNAGSFTAIPVENIKKQCLEFGFKEGSEKFADCQLKLYMISMQQNTNTNQTIVIENTTQNDLDSKIDPSVWNDLQGISEGLLQGKSLTEALGGASSQSNSRTCFKINERTSGTNKICSYNCMGSEVTRNIRSTQICPISIKN